MPQRAPDADTVRGLAFLTGDGLEIADIRDVANPIHLGTVHTPPGAAALLLSRGELGPTLVLTGDGEGIVRVLDDGRETPVAGALVRLLDRDGDELDVSQITVPIFARVPAGADKMNITLFASGISSEEGAE